ncbi:LPXTG cell wall anchor domain-containing protein [Neobacillus mesonae]|uniref:LPXTG cell wall anchor domain-containing protein n=1 Tax=Neobacillus mesonae TaxID=1193713 RepID=UPI002E1C4000|nr:excalibur calcium-binding domain-containing protein [Neobacillus mesonae]
MKKALLSLLMTSFVFVFGLQNVSAQSDKNCPDFSTWNEAQTYFEQNGGSPTNNVDDLDRDGDGLACEDLAGAPDKTTWNWATDRLLPTTDGGTVGDGDNAGGQMPETATNNVNGIIAGVMIMAAGFLFFLRKRKAN